MKTKSKLVLGLSILSAATLAAATTSTFAWFAATAGAVAGSQFKAITVSNPSISLDETDIAQYVTVNEESDTSGQTLLLSYVDSSTLKTKYWDDGSSQAYDLPAKYVTSGMTMYRIYKIGLSAITDQETKNAINANDLKVTVTNDEYIALGGSATFDGRTTYYTVTDGKVATPEVTAGNFDSLKATLKIKQASRARVAIHLVKGSLSLVPDGTNVNATYNSAYGNYHGSAIAALAYVSVRVDGGSSKDSSAVETGFTVKVEAVAHP